MSSWGVALLGELAGKSGVHETYLADEEHKQNK